MPFGASGPGCAVAVTTTGTVLAQVLAATALRAGGARGRGNGEREDGRDGECE